MKYLIIPLTIFFSSYLNAAEFIPKKLSQMTDDLGIGTHTADTSDPHGATATQTNLTVGSLTVTGSLGLGTVTLSGYMADNGGSATSARLTSVQINSGTGTLSAATIAGVSAPYPAQNSGTCTGLTANNTKLSGNTAIGTTTAATDVVDIDLGSGNMLIQSSSGYPQTQEIRGGAAADGNLLATKIYQGKDSAGNSTNYAGIYSVSSNVTNGSEQGTLDFYLSDAGSYALRGRWKGLNLGIGTSTPQTKLHVNGDISIQTSGYLNFAPNTGTASSGYGIRDNAGTMQYKGNAGTWTDIPSGASGGGFIDNGTNITETTVADQVLIGTTSVNNRQFNCVGSSTFYGQVAIGSNTTIVSGLNSTLLELVLGDNDTGFKWLQDGDFALYGNGDEQIKIDGNADKVLIGTTTSGTRLNVGGTVTAGGFSGNGAGLTNLPSQAFSQVTGSATASQLPLISGLIGSATASQLPTVIRLPATTTAQAAGDYGQLYVNSSNATSGYESIVLLLHMNNPGGSGTTFVDSSPSSHTITTSGDAVGTSTSKFGSGAGYFAGTGDYLTGTDSAILEFAAGDFTIDYWIKFLDTATGAHVSHWDISSTGWEMYWGGNVLTFIFNSGTQVDRSWTPTLNTWYHVEIDRSGANLYDFIDGTQLGATYNIGTTSIADSAVGIGIAARTTGGIPANIVMDELCISKGVARHTGNFTPPTAEYSSNYTQYNAIYKNPVAGTDMILLQSPGTATTEKSYILNNATMTAFGYGTTTGLLNTSTVYSAEAKYGVAATVFGIKSVDKIKGHKTRFVNSVLSKVRGINLWEWDLIVRNTNGLDAEAQAKSTYIDSKKDDWLALNRNKYIVSSKETGTGTVNTYDKEAMSKDYKTYVELEWASDLEQPDLVDAEKENMDVDYGQHLHGFRVSDPTTPKEIIVSDGSGISMMDAIAISYKAIQELDAIVQLQKTEIDELRVLVNP